MSSAEDECAGEKSPSNLPFDKQPHSGVLLMRVRKGTELACCPRDCSTVQRPEKVWKFVLPCNEQLLTVTVACPFFFFSFKCEEGNSRVYLEFK